MITRDIDLDLSRFSAAPSARLSHFPFESDGAFPTQCRVSTSWIVEAVDVFEDRHPGMPAGVPGVPPDQFCLDRFEERLNRCSIIAISFAAHPLPCGACFHAREGRP
jgi:hypothetical protein